MGRRRGWSADAPPQPQAVLRGRTGAGREDQQSRSAPGSSSCVGQAVAGYARWLVREPVRAGCASSGARVAGRRSEAGFVPRGTSTYARALGLAQRHVGEASSFAISALLSPAAAMSVDTVRAALADYPETKALECSYRGGRSSWPGAQVALVQLESSHARRWKPKSSVGRRHAPLRVALGANRGRVERGAKRW